MASPDRARFERIFTDHYESVSRYCHRRLPSDDANDATAEVFVVVWRKIDAVPDAPETLPWLYGVARNEVSRSRRSAGRRGSLKDRLAGLASPPTDGPDVVVVQGAEEAALLEALARLRPADQEILRLRAFEHLSLEEAAIVLGCSLPAAKQRSARAIRRLRSVVASNVVPTPVQRSRAFEEGGGG